MRGKELRVKKIKDGTVIDHITGGRALAVLRILSITGDEDAVVSVSMNVPSKKIGQKDIVKVEGRELNPAEVDKIALIAPRATINIVRNYEVVKKENVKLPHVISGNIKCVNPSCISNTEEPVKPTFTVESREPIRLRCHYCGRFVENEDVYRQL